MFTWICPNCGKDVDVAQKTCPRCAAAGESPGEAATETATAPPPPAPAERRLRQEAAPRQSRPAAPKKSLSSLDVRPRHLLLFGAALLLAVGAAVQLSRPGLLRLEAVAEPAEESVQTFSRGAQGPLEVAGIRPYYTDEHQTKVKAFVANHSDEGASVALRVLLRHRQAADNAPPLGAFDIVLPEPLEARGAMEIDTGLEAMGSLQSLPPWREIRVDVEAK